ncbi:MAG: cytochrome C oxidase subunit IV family protein [Thalassotalea sp.]
MVLTVGVKQALLCWFSLIVLTLVSVFLGSVIDSVTLFTVLVFAIVFIKGQQIVDTFMELRNAPTKWRMVMLAYVFIMPSIIGGIYLW